METKQDKFILLFIALFLLFAFVLVSCKKQKDCYVCTHGISNGVYYPPSEYCYPDGGMRQFFDIQGNVLQSICTQK